MELISLLVVCMAVTEIIAAQIGGRAVCSEQRRLLAYQHNVELDSTANLVTSSNERRSHLELHGQQWRNVIIFGPENGEIRETSVGDRGQVEALEERTQQRLQSADQPVPTGGEKPLFQQTQR